MGKGHKLALSKHTAGSLRMTSFRISFTRMTLFYWGFESPKSTVPSSAKVGPGSCFWGEKGGMKCKAVCFLPPLVGKQAPRISPQKSVETPSSSFLTHDSFYILGILGYCCILWICFSLFLHFEWGVLRFSDRVLPLKQACLLWYILLGC